MARLLLVDDEPAFRLLIRMLVEDQAGYEVVGEAADGSEAIAAAGRLKPDLVLLDLRMPRMDGLTALPKIRLASPASRVVVLSVAADQQPLHQAKMAGADAFIDKALDNESFLEALAQCAAGRAGWREFRQRDLDLNERRARLQARMARPGPGPGGRGGA